MNAIVDWFKAFFFPTSFGPSSITPCNKERPLFSGYLACFSPSVDRAIRVLWVKNGGTLTHTAADFRNARFFFCIGMDDPWLKELLSRSLIVRHASWVTLCVAEKFLMPIACYTLDEFFDESKIHVLYPSTPALQSRGIFQDNSKPQRMKSDMETGNVEPSRKRKISLESELQRPIKKARMDMQGSQVDVWRVSGRKSTNADGRPRGSYARIIEKPGGSVPRRISFTGRGTIPFGKVSRTAKAFEGRIVLSKARPSPAHEEAHESVKRPLNPHTLFWNDLLAKSYAKDAKKLTFSVDDLLLAPETKAVVFDVNKTYRGRRFINMEYA